MSDPAPRKKRLPFRWLSLAELVGIVAVVIAALGYWDTHRERTQTAQERAAEAREKKAEAQAGALKLSFLMTGAPEGNGDRLRLTTVHSEQVIQTTGNPRIEAGWFEDGLAKALHARGDKRHQGRLPVGVATSFIEDGQNKTDQAIYLIGYSTHPRVLRSDKVEMEGLSLVRRGVTGDLQAAVDALWSRQNPPPAKP
jgi:hypothetical protein